MHLAGPKAERDWLLKRLGNSAHQNKVEVTSQVTSVSLLWKTLCLLRDGLGSYFFNRLMRNT